MRAKSIFTLWLAFSCCHFNAAAQTWTQALSVSETTYAVFGVAMSADGCKLAATTSYATVSDTGLLVSSDSGQHWQTNQSSPQNVITIASSADGTKLVTSVVFSDVQISTNSGSTWTATAVPVGNDYNEALCSSALGNILAATANNGLIYVSTNSGLTWTSNTLPVGSWAAIASSADGTKLAAAAPGYKIYISTNFGTTWTATQSTSDSWISLACSADGAKLIASGSATYISTNFGGQWRRASTMNGYVASSADGRKLIIAGEYPNGAIYTSSNSGVSWVSNNVPALGWSSVACSADGNELMAGGVFGGIWIGRTVSAPKLNMSVINDNPVLSWLVPSTNFVVQQKASLTTANWVTLTNAPTFNAATLSNQMVLPNTNANQGFFRLATQ